MISAKNIYHTRAYKQMKAYCKGDKAKLKELVQQFVDNRNNPDCNLTDRTTMKTSEGLSHSNSVVLVVNKTTQKMRINRVVI